MGLEHTAAFEDCIPCWKEVRDLLDSHGYPVQLRMVGNELTFPDELPPDDWHEIRVGRTEGMVTLRGSGNRLTLVTWGTDDPDLARLCNALLWAFAHVGNGKVTDDNLTADQFRAVALMPKELANA